MKKKSKKENNQKMLDLMYKNYGTQINYIEVDVHMIASEVLSYVGKPCKEYERDCPTCDAWDQWNKKGTVKVILYRDNVIKMIMKS
jgi:hypothetical protein